MTHSQNAQTVRDMLDAAWNNGDLSAIERAVAEHHLEHDPDGDKVGREHVTETVREYRTAFPDLHMSCEDQIADGGDRVVTRWIASGTHRGELDGIAATGRTAQISGVYIHRLEDGQIAECWTSYDRFGLLRQLGIIPAPPG